MIAPTITQSKKQLTISIPVFKTIKRAFFVYLLLSILFGVAAQIYAARYVLTNYQLKFEAKMISPIAANAEDFSAKK